MAVLDDLQTAKAQVVARFLEITANPRPSYSLDGQAVSWTEYHAMLVTQLKALNDLIQVEGGPIEYRTQGVS